MDGGQSYEGWSDGSLMADLSAGNLAAGEVLFRRYSQRLLTIARSRLSRYLLTRLDPEDIVQSAFKSFFRRASTGGYVAPAAGDLFNLLIVITMRKVNAHADYNQAGMRDVRRSVDGENLDGQAGRETDRLRDLLLTIDEVCADLTSTQRQIVHWRLEGFEVAEIAQKVQRSKRTVERELQNFRQLLSGYFDP